MTRTPRRLALAASAALLLLTGCGDSSQVRAGAAAIVGSEKITTEQLQALVERGLADPQAAQQLGADREAYQRQALSRLINTAVLERAAQEQGVEVTPGEVAAQLELFATQAGGREALEQQAAQSGISTQDLEPFVRSIVLDQQLGDALTEDTDVPAADLQAIYQENIAQYDRVRTRHILVPEEATARTILKNVTRDRSRFEPLAAQFSTDTSNKDNGGDLGLAGRGQFVPAFENAIFGAKPGDIVIVNTQFGWHVVEVLDRQTTTLAQATPELRRTALQAERQSAVQEVLSEVSRELGIKVNPRFGTYNRDTGQVEPIASANGVLTPGADPGDVGGEVPELDADGNPPEVEGPPPGAPPVEEPAPSPAG